MNGRNNNHKDSVCNFNYSQTLLINEEPRAKKIKSSYNGKGGGGGGLLPNSDFNTACRIQLTFVKVEPLKASVESNRSFSSQVKWGQTG